MGRRGPPKKPTAKKVIEGTFRKDRAKNEPKPAAKVPSCPSWVRPEGKREWRRIVKELAALDMLTNLDRAALAAYCDSYALFLEANRILKKEGVVIETAMGNVIQHPAVGIRNKAWSQIKDGGARFGLTPADRADIDLPTGAGKAVSDPWAALAGGLRSA